MNYNDNLLKDNKPTILMLSWRDIKNPKGGGAEVHTHEMLKRSALNGKYRIIHLSPMFANATTSEIIDGIHYIRKGGTFSVIFYAFFYYIRNHKNIDFVIDQCNAHRFFTKFWVNKRKRIFYTHQLYRELWQIMLPGFLGHIGAALETPLLRMNRHDITITVSDSTKQGLLDVGYDPDKIYIIPNGLNFSPKNYVDLELSIDPPIFIYVGRFVPYKGIDKAVKSFIQIKKKYPSAKLWIVGRVNEQYVIENLHPLCVSNSISDGYDDNCDVKYWGFVSEKQKYDLLEKSTAMVFPATREGWGIVITEAAAMGTPSIVSNCAGCVDAVNFGHAGYLCHNNTVSEIVNYMTDIIENKSQYENMRKSAYEFAVKFQWDQTALLFEALIDKLYKGE